MKNLSKHKAFLLSRASLDDNYLAFTLDQYLHADGKEWPELLEELSCNEENLLKLALCRNLKLSDPNYSDQLERVSLYVGVDPIVLSGIIKRSAFHAVIPTKKEGSVLPLHNSYLAAAREKDTTKDSSKEKEE